MDGGGGAYGRSGAELESMPGPQLWARLKAHRQHSSGGQPGPWWPAKGWPLHAGFSSLSAVAAVVAGGPDIWGWPGHERASSVSLSATGVRRRAAEVPPCRPAAGHTADHPGAPTGGQALCGSRDYVLPSKAGESPGRGRPAAPCELALTPAAQALGLSPRTDVPKPT